ncbi:integrase [Microbacterium mangrovi]|uniref:Integrase n=1 Tax=Microbacterium mangrovi TaxID=1348253 RepID=A0A0B2A4D9_9MICO|nr:site-specific integrase [Microbacterium mangrovi]KHK98324.1 integrase [Microbacterium mangrovi]
MGSVEPYETVKGRRYRVRYRTPENKQTDKRGFRTKRDADLFLASVELSKARGEFVDAAAGRVVLAELARGWLISQQAHLKPSSYAWVEGGWRVYVEPKWGAVRISEIQHSSIQSWVAALTAGTAPSTKKASSPLSPSTVRQAFGVLNSILEVAVRDRLLLANPAKDVQLPRKVRKRRQYLTHAQVERLAVACGDEGLYVLFLAYTGLRWGEMVALRVRDLDMLRKRVSVQENAVRVNGQIAVGTPKTHHARSVPFPEFLAGPLATSCDGKARDSLVFGNGRVYLSQPTHRDAWFTRSMRQLRESDPSFPAVTVHDLRHTAASLAISAGANVKAVQRMLGHASAAMTLDTYADLFDDDLDAVSEALDAARSAANVGKLWAIEAPKAIAAQTSTVR